MTSTSNRPVSDARRELSRRNRRIIAERIGDPAGSVEACERIEEMFPGFEVGWFSENTTPGFEREAGFYAWVEGHQPGYYSPGHGFIRRAEWYGRDPQDLERVLRELGVRRDAAQVR